MLPDRLIKFFSSLRLTVVCLGFGVVLVFLGTIRQVDLGLYKAQNDYFRSFFVYWGPKDASWQIPILPGGYLLGGVLLINLVTAHFTRFKFTRKKVGIWMIHFGVILLLLGQLLTDMLSRETILHLREGEAKNYTESQRQAELAVIDTTDPRFDTVIAVPQSMLASQKEIRHRDLPFTVRVKEYYPNSSIEERAATNTSPPVASEGLGPRAVLKPLPRETDLDKRDFPSAVVEVVTPQGSLGTWLVSEIISRAQSFALGGRTYTLTMRAGRVYKPFTIQLLKFQHDVYAGTDIPKNFSSRVLLQRPSTGERREVLIYMNSPLRYAGETYYQADYDHQDDKGTILQVVHNPSWLTPYFSCILVGAGLLVQFMMHLTGFAMKRRPA
jgi:ResB-like family